MQKYRIAIVGATGLVGQKMLEVLLERQIPISDVLPIASRESAGKTVSFGDEKLKVFPLKENIFEGVDFALFSAGAQISREYAPVAVRQGAVVIDNSSAWRMEPHVPLVVPEVNGHALKTHQGIIANPNCSTIQLVMVLSPLHKRFGVKRVVVSTYQAVSGSGKAAIKQLKDELHQKNPVEKVYPHPIAYNCLPHIDSFEPDGYSREEHKMMQETSKIMEDESLAVTATCVRVPVLNGHSESVNIEFRSPITVEGVRKVLEEVPGVVVLDQPEENIYPLPILCDGKDEVFVGRIRRDPTVENAINLWIVSDNLRKGAATNAVQILQHLINMGG